MKWLFLSFFLSFTFNGFSQLNKQILPGKYGDSTVTFHENHQVSTIDYRIDGINRLNQTIVFDSKGKEIFRGVHGYQYGSHGLYLTFFPNGQVSSIRETMQPDGGIQFKDKTYYYNEAGVLTSQKDHSLPPKLIAPSKPYQQEIVRETSVAPAKDSTFIWLKNTSNKKVSILLRNKTTGKDNILKIKPQQKIQVGAFINYTDKMEPETFFEVIVLTNQSKRHLSLVKNSSLDTKTNKFWLLIEGVEMIDEKQ